MACVLAAGVAGATFLNFYSDMTDASTVRWMMYRNANEVAGGTNALAMYDDVFQGGVPAASQDYFGKAIVISDNVFHANGSFDRTAAFTYPSRSVDVALGAAAPLDKIVILTTQANVDVSFDFYNNRADVVHVQLQRPDGTTIDETDIQSFEALASGERTKFVEKLPAPAAATDAAIAYRFVVFQNNVQVADLPVYVGRTTNTNENATVNYGVEPAASTRGVTFDTPEHSTYTAATNATQTVDMGVFMRSVNNAGLAMRDSGVVAPANPTISIYWYNFARHNLQEVANDTGVFNATSLRFREDLGTVLDGSLKTVPICNYVPARYVREYQIRPGTQTSGQSFVRWAGWNTITYTWRVAASDGTNVVATKPSLSNIDVQVAPFAPNQNLVGNTITRTQVAAARINADAFSLYAASETKALDGFQFTISNDVVPGANSVIYAPLRVAMTLHRDEVIAKYGNSTWTDLLQLAGDARSQANYAAFFSRIAPMKVVGSSVVNLANLPVAKDKLTRYFNIRVAGANTPDVAVVIEYLTNVVDMATPLTEGPVVATEGYFLVFDGAKDGKIVDPVYVSEPTTPTPTAGPTGTPTPTGPTATPTSGGSSSGGCSAFGFAPLALLLLAPLALLRKRG